VSFASCVWAMLSFDLSQSLNAPKGVWFLASPFAADGVARDETVLNDVILPFCCGV